MLIAATARRRWQQVDTAMRRGESLPTSRTAVPISVGVVTAATLALVLVALL